MSARSRKPTDPDKTAPERPAVREPARDSMEDAKTSIFDSGNYHKPSNRTGPIQVISMKTPGNEKIAADHMTVQPLKRPKLRAMSEVSSPAVNLGYLAPPVDHSQRRKRKARDAIMIASLSIIIACAIALVIWFVAG